MQLRIVSRVRISGPPGYIGCPGPQAGYPVPPAGYASPGPAGFPVQHQPVTSHPGEPTQVSWMPAPLPPLNCPPGLEYLTQVIQYLKHSLKTKLCSQFT